MKLKAYKTILKAKYPSTSDYEADRRSFLKSVVSKIGASLYLSLLLSGCSTRRKPKEDLVNICGAPIPVVNYQAIFKSQYNHGKRLYKNGEYIEARITWYRLFTDHNSHLTNAQKQALKDCIDKVDKDIERLSLNRNLVPSDY